ncbi:hypothetical protein BB560_000832 [Smittium megazygosporum]|uniref:Uncharacterized protein n=1 Tax=Smittium megazygosporum TaxID=133381 RepID=A0A2T9ZJD2_9FUNG|nr:hypothetical protein BB560_000832 [Smittium megazygosporum]
MNGITNLPGAHSQNSKTFLLLEELEKSQFRNSIKRHPFNHKIEVLCIQDPGTNFALPDPIQSFLDSSDLVLYKSEIKLLDFLEKEFILKYIHKGSFIAISWKNKIDQDNVVSIDGNGILYLSLCKDSYEASGLLGKPVLFSKTSDPKYLITIDLKSKAMAFDSKAYKRVKWSFSNVLTEAFEIIYSYSDPESSPFPSPLFHKCIQEWTKKSDILLTPDSISNLALLDTTENLNYQSDSVDICEWIGMSTLDSDFLYPENELRPIDPFISVYTVPSPHSKKLVSKLSSVGIISPFLVEMIHRLLMENFNNFIVTCWGFEDSPISWVNSDHGYFVSGENVYSNIVDKTSNKIFRIRHCGSYDRVS